MAISMSTAFILFATYLKIVRKELFLDSVYLLFMDILVMGILKEYFEVLIPRVFSKRFEP